MRQVSRSTVSGATLRLPWDWRDSLEERRTHKAAPPSEIQRPVRVRVPLIYRYASPYKSTERLAVRVVPLYEAEIVAEVETRTMDVLTVKVALLAPAGTITLIGTLAAPLLLESMTCTPPVGAAPLKVTVPVEDCSPPITLEGFSVTEARVG